MTAPTSSVVADAAVRADEPLVRVGEDGVARTQVEEQRSAADEGFEVASEGPRRASKKIGDELALPANPLEEWATLPLPDVEPSCFDTQMRAAGAARGQVLAPPHLEPYRHDPPLGQ
jgi:hypothetical protein